MWLAIRKILKLKFESEIFFFDFGDFSFCYLSLLINFSFNFVKFYEDYSENTINFIKTIKYIVSSVLTFLKMNFKLHSLFKNNIILRIPKVFNF